MTVAILPFTAFAASQIATPGPANMALLATGAGHGFRAALPFMFGVALGKQLIIWPIGLGLLTFASDDSLVYQALKWGSALYICWLAWRVANLRLRPGQADGPTPRFWQGLIVHPLNPKAWAMIPSGFTAFVDPGADPLASTATIALILLICQLIFHPIWTFAGDRIAALVAGTRIEPYLMWTLAGLTVLSVGFVLFGGGTHR